MKKSSSKQYIYGIHAVLGILQHHPERVIRLYLSKQREDNKLHSLEELANANNISIEWSPKEKLDKLSEWGNHQGALAYCISMPTYTEKDLDELLPTFSAPLLILVLDAIQDPHNLGACFRSAEAAGAHAIIVPKDKSAGLTPTVSKVASGTADIVPFIQVTNLVRTLNQLKEQGIWIYGAAGEAKQTLYQADLTHSAALVLGQEGMGLRHLTRQHCDQLLSIPQKGTVNSLNVSVAAGIFLFEALRQRGTNTPKH